jgi:hypothetical protein
LINSTIKQTHIPSEDDLLHFILPVNDGKTKNIANYFGVVFKSYRLKREDDRILSVVKGIFY